MYFDRFDIVEAHYCYFVLYHGGQNSVEYERLGKMLKYFKPSHALKEYLCDELTDNGYEIFLALIEKNA